MLAILYNGLYSEYSYETKSLIEVYFNLKQFYVAVIIEILACRHDPDEEFDVAVSMQNFVYRWPKMPKLLNDNIYKVFGDFQNLV